MTERNAEQLEFHALGRRGVVGKFDGGKISSDGGGLLPGEVEARTHILERLAGQDRLCARDKGKPLASSSTLNRLQLTPGGCRRRGAL